MTQVGINLLAVILTVLLAFAPNAYSDTTNQAPDFKEVYELIRSHLAGATDEELSRASVDGLLAQLQGRVSISGADNPDAASGPLTSHVNLLDDGVAYVRVGRVASGLAEELNGTWQRLKATNQINGLVLDLRFAGGNDYQAAAAVADLFTAKERVLLDWGDGAARSKAKSDAIILPVAALVNRRTSGAAEALAAALRETGAGLVLGSKTAGTAMISQAYPLRNGQRLLIATQPVKAGDGVMLSPQGIKPDIEVAVNLESERRYLEDAFAPIAATDNMNAGQTTETNRTARRTRLSEADLVRERRDGTAADDASPARKHESDKPLVRDPVLARAVDLLKGLAVVRGTKS